jgi:hypothetical protein
MGLTCVTNFIVTAVTILFFPNLSKNFSNYPLVAPSANVMELNHSRGLQPHIPFIIN